VSKVNSQTLPKDTLLIIIIELFFSYTSSYSSLSPWRERARVRGRK